MQSQALKTPLNKSLLTVEHSLASVQTLLTAGLGCITYLRNLLPEDNFEKSNLMFARTPASQPSNNSRSLSTESNSDVSGFKIMTIARGYTDEGDTLLNYMESGIFDALEKQYLKSFIFGICIDNQDPNNLVEAYTFNFKYYSVPGCETKVPVMTLGDDLMKLSLDGSAVSGAFSNKKPTLGEVKRKLKDMVKTLIQATSHMEMLPKRRFATFKLFYYDHTPEDYNPTMFRPGDLVKDRWVVSTHNVSEVPERWSIGCLETGHHGVDIRVASVASFLPSGEDNNATFIGIGGNSDRAPALSLAEQNSRRMQQIEIQNNDALNRRIVYDIDGLGVEDQKGIDDPDYLQTTRDAPIGIKNDENIIVPLPNDIDLQQSESRTSSPMDIDTQNIGFENAEPSMFTNAPKHVRQLNARTSQRDSDDMEPTQQLDVAQNICSITPRPQGLSRMQSASLPPSEPDENTYQSITSKGIDTQVVISAVGRLDTEDSEILDLETQVVPSYPHDPIQSFSSVENTSRVIVPDAGLKCECGVDDDIYDCCWCESCGHWYHTWCVGYHSAIDKRLPEKWVCLDCRIRADKNWELIALHELYPLMVAKYKEVALFRKALKLFEVTKPGSISQFAKKVGCTAEIAGQLFKRLEAEGFIAQEMVEVDKLGLMETRKATNRGKGKGFDKKQGGQRRNLQRTKFVFVPGSRNTKEYTDYFDPDPAVQQRLIGMKELISQRKLKDINLNLNTMAELVPEIPQMPLDESQTQEDSQRHVLPMIQASKRKTTVEGQRTSKRTRISVAPMVEFGE